MKLERRPAILGVNFGRDFWGGGGLKPWRNKAEDFASKFAGEIR